MRKRYFREHELLKYVKRKFSAKTKFDKNVDFQDENSKFQKVLDLIKYVYGMLL